MMRAVLLCLVAVVAAKVLTDTKFTIVHVTDVHGWVAGHPHNATLNADFGDFQSFLTHMRANAAASGEEFLLFDTGDLIEGTGLSDCTTIHGEYIFPIIKMIESYEAMAIGNHDIGHDNVVSLMKQDFIPYWNGSYLTANAMWMDDIKSSGADFMGNPYRVINLQSGINILALGYIYDFTQNANLTQIVDVTTSVTQAYFEQAMAIPDIDMVVVVCHIAPQTPSDVPNIYQAIRAKQPKIPIILLSGHSHVEYYQQYDDNAFTFESGKYFEEIGVLEFSLSPYHNLDDFSYEWVSTSVQNFQQMTDTDNKTFSTPESAVIKKAIATYSALLDLDEVFGCSPATYGLYTPPNEANSMYGLLLDEIVPNVLFVDPPSGNQPFYFTNPFFLRYGLYEGTVNRNDIFTVCGFNDTMNYFPSINGTFLNKILSWMSQAPPMARAAARTCATDSADGDLPPLPPFYSYPATVDTSATYDLYCSDYDCITTQALVLANAHVTLEFERLPNMLTDTYMIKDYVQQFMPCKSK